MTQQTDKLDTEELLHLALRATQSNQTEEGIQYLKRALEQSPDNANVLYLLGALHAEIGMYPRAIEEISHAVKIDPNLNAAHFQLGLLHLTSGDLANAKDTWKALDKLGETNELFLFKTGMLLLSNDQFEECIEYLEKGIKANHTNPALNKDMERMVNKAKEALKQNTTAADNDKNDTKEDNRSVGNKLLLSAYEKREEDDIH